jgi:hypothetical protein
MIAGSGGSGEGYAALMSCRCSLGIQVKDDFHVIGHESNRNNNDRRYAGVPGGVGRGELA